MVPDPHQRCQRHRLNAEAAQDFTDRLGLPRLESCSVDFLGGVPARNPRPKAGRSSAYEICLSEIERSGNPLRQRLTFDELKLGLPKSGIERTFGTARSFACSVFAVQPCQSLPLWQRCKSSA